MRSAWTGAVAAAIAAAAIASGCGGDDNNSQFDGGADDGGSDATGGDASLGAIDVEPQNASLVSPLGGPAPKQAYQAFATINGQKTDVTSQCTFAPADPSFGTFQAATFIAQARGGTVNINATCGASGGSAKLSVTLAGQVLLGNVPATAPATFKGAQGGSDPAHTPAIEYPLDGAIAPLNIPSIDTQWSAAQNDLFHVSLVSPHVQIDAYTTAADAQIDDATWTTIAKSASGETLAITVEGLAQASPQTKYASKAAKLVMSRDVIDNTALYYWASSKGDLMTQTFGATGAPTAVHGDCTSCHSLSRSGSRVGYSRCVANDCGQLFAGFMRYDTQSMAWKDTLDANTKALQASYSTFSPVGYPFADDSKSVALVSKATCVLSLYDPDTGQPVASNVETISPHDGSGAGARCATMPDWSPDGHSVVFASTPHAGQWIDVSDSAIATMGYTFANGAHTFAEPKIIISAPITLASGTYNNFFFPSYSPDGKVIVFNAARAAWRNFSVAGSPGQRLMLADPQGAWTVDLPGLNGAGDLDITWPHWAPAQSSDYYWIVFSSERDYGHKLTKANTASACVQNGVQQCKQIWIAALDKSKLTGGRPTVDPSAPPVWMPGQDIDADNISPYWTVPTSSIPR